MDYADLFKRFANDFETCVVDDNWGRLGSYLTADATYLNVGGPEDKICGRDAILDFFKKDVSESDRLFDTRRLESLSEPIVEDNFLTRNWRSTFTLSQTPDLVLDGVARYWYTGDSIKAIEEELTPESAAIFQKWMREHGEKLHA